jgi:hypothetical protein
MKMIMLALAMLVSMWLAAPALAHIVEVTTAIDVGQTDDPVELKQALREAVDEVVRDTVAFEPTLVALTDAQRVGERVYVRILVADEEGEQMLKGASPRTQPPSDPTGPSAPGGPSGGRRHEVRI